MIAYLTAAVLLLPAMAAATVPPSSCEVCHETLAGPFADPVRRWKVDVHGSAGIGCPACHGGDPASLDNPKGRGLGYIGAPSPSQEIDLCGGCHGDAARMVPYGLRIDQETLYRLGAHGQALEAGLGSPTCPDCHGAHGILPASDPLSPVSLRGSVQTCSRCHQDRGRQQPEEAVSPPAAAEKFSEGTHGRALLKSRNPNAPSCPTCHGAHANRTPRGGEAVHVCGSCHVTEKAFFLSGPHGDSLTLFGEPACPSCHGSHLQAPADPRWTPAGILGLCQRCHDGEGGPAILGRALVEDLASVLIMLEETRDLARLVSLRGFDAEPMNIALLEAHSWVKQAITALHSANRDQVEPMAGMARARIVASRELISQHLLEIAIRRAGLGITAVLLLAGAVLLFLKLMAVKKEQAVKALLEETDSRDERAPE